MIVASSDFVYTSKSLFWPDVIMLSAVDLDLMQSVSMTIGVQRQTEMHPITVIFAGINDHLHSRDFLSKDILESMGEVVGKYDVIISAANRGIEMQNLRPLRAELSAVWSGISNAMRGFKNHSLHMLVLDEMLGLELSNFSRQLKLKPGIDDDH